jgi:hypothetical protein
MPHDRDGHALNVGDLVLVPCRVKAIHQTEDYCNVDLEVRARMPPGHSISTLALNAKQVVKETP